MKRTKSLTVMITVFALFSLTGCGNSQQGSNESRDNNPSSLSDLSSKVDTESGTVSYDQQEQSKDNTACDEQLIDDFIYFYNHQRVQLKTKLTPLELRSQFVA